MKRPAIQLFKTLFAVLVLTLIVFLVAPASRADDSAAETFIRSFRDFAQRIETDTTLTWTMSASPWSPYLKTQFEAGLTESERKQARKNAGAMRCNAVVVSEMIGFVGLYPELRPILSAGDVRANFETVILPAHSFALKRCRALAEIEQLATIYYLSYKGAPQQDIVDIINLLVGPSIWIPPDRPTQKAAIDLIHLLACDEYMIVFDDLIDLNHRHGIELIRSARFARYLTLRARQLGKPVDDDNAVFAAAAKRSYSVRDADTIAAIERFMTAGDLKSAQERTFVFNAFCPRKPVSWQPRG